MEPMHRVRRSSILQNCGIVLILLAVAATLLTSVLGEPIGERESPGAYANRVQRRTHIVRLVVGALSVAGLTLVVVGRCWRGKGDADGKT